MKLLGRIAALYEEIDETRNRVAHGRLEVKRIDVLAAVADFYVIQGAIKN